MKVNLTEAQLNGLLAILKDHKDCLKRSDFPMTSGKELAEKFPELNLNEAEIDSKANLIWEVEELIEVLERAEG